MPRKRQPITTPKLRGKRPAAALLPERLEQLVESQQHFVLEYLSNGYNATEAYAQAHPAAKRTTAAAEGYRLLRHPAIAAIIQREERKRWTRLQMDGDEALGLISLVARADIAEAFDEKGELRPVREWPKDLRLCVKSIRPGAFGDTLVFYDALHAREIMAQVAGRLKPEGSIAASLATLAQLLTGQYDPDEDRED